MKKEQIIQIAVDPSMVSAGGVLGRDYLLEGGLVALTNLGRVFYFSRKDQKWKLIKSPELLTPNK